MSDNMRYNLVTTFVCSQCGNPLRLSYEHAKVQATQYNPSADDGITGAAKVQQRVAIHPCDTCYEEVKAPLDALRKVLAKVK